MEDMTQEAGSQTVESQTDSGTQETAVADAFAAFGLTAPETQERTSENGIERDTTDDDAPAIEQTETPKTIKIKHNKEEVEVSEDQIPELLQKGMALDKVRTQKSEVEKAFDEAAKLLGLKDHADFLANRDRLQQQQQQRQENEFTQLRNQLITDYEDAGGDPRNLEVWLDSNPLLNRAKQVLEQDEQRREQDQKAEVERQHTARWQEFYQAYPEHAASSSAFAEGGKPEWFTDEMQGYVAQGYQPLHAYKLAHMGTIQAQAKKAGEQKTIKDQMLGRRAQVETVTPADTEPSVPGHLTSAFAAFGLDPKAAKKYVK